jgi:hypothetical protein
MKVLWKRLFGRCPEIAAVIDPATKRATARALGDLRRARKSNDRAINDILASLAHCKPQIGNSARR